MKHSEPAFAAAPIETPSGEVVAETAPGSNAEVLFPEGEVVE